MRLYIRAEDLTIDHDGQGEIVGGVERTGPLGRGMLDINVGGRFLKVRSSDDVQQGQEIVLTIIRHPKYMRREQPFGDRR